MISQQEPLTVCVRRSTMYQRGQAPSSLRRLEVPSVRENRRRQRPFCRFERRGARLVLPCFAFKVVDVPAWAPESNRGLPIVRHGQRTPESTGRIERRSHGIKHPIEREPSFPLASGSWITGEQKTRVLNQFMTRFLLIPLTTALILFL